MQINPSYAQILSKINAETFSIASPAMLSMNEKLFKSDKLLNYRFYRHAWSEKLGSDAIIRVAGRVADVSLRSEMVRHGDDEARHSKIFSALAAKTGEAIGFDHDRESAEDESNKQVDLLADDVASFLCDTHVAEIRTYYMLNQYVKCSGPAVLKYGEGFRSALQSVQSDEERHITYSGKHLNRWLDSNEVTPERLSNTVMLYSRSGWLEIAEMAYFLSENE